MHVPKLTKTLIESMEPDPQRARYLWDTQLGGFGVKVLPSGARRYVVKYRVGGGRGAQQRWLGLGKHGTVTCEQARESARQVLAAVARGEDPQGERQEKRDAARMTDLWARFADEQLPLKKPRSAEEYRTQWRDYLGPAFAMRLVAEITRSDIDRLHKKMRDVPYRANRVLALLSRLMTLAEAWGMRREGSNPCRHIERFREQPRERYLSMDEIARLGVAMGEMLASGEITPEAAAAIRLLLLTGARKNEILTVERSWIDLDRKVINLSDSKTGKKPLYLSDAAVAVVRDVLGTADPESPYLLPGRATGKPLNNLAKPWRRLCERAGLTGVRLHDLRHTAASIAVGRGVNLPVIGRLLGHSQAQTTMRYAHVDKDPAIAAANSIGAAVSGALGVLGTESAPAEVF